MSLSDVSFSTAPSLAVGELVELYGAVGWSAYTQDPVQLQRAVDGSSFVVAARRGGLLIGLARAVSDGATICYLQDLLVDPSEQRRGIGTRLCLAVLDHYAGVRQKVVLTDAEPGQRAFYESLGYQELRDVSGAELRAFVRFDA